MDKHKNGMPKTFTKTVHVLTHPDFGASFLTVSDTELRDHGYLVVCSKEVSFDIPEFDIVNKTIEILREQKQKVLAEAQVRANQIEERISHMLALEHAQ